jgi:hypothetical protein
VAVTGEEPLPFGIIVFGLWLLLRDVLAQGDRAAEVDVLDLRAGAFGVHVRHEADHPGHGALNGDLCRAHQRHGVETELAGR